MQKEMQISDQDIVLAYSDGLDDNLYEDDKRLCITPYLKDGVLTSISKVADCLAVKANIFSKDKSFASPFNTQWKKAFENGEPMGTKPPPGYNFLGGKQDDITVTVA